MALVVLVVVKIAHNGWCLTQLQIVRGICVLALQLRSSTCYKQTNFENGSK